MLARRAIAWTAALACVAFVVVRVLGLESGYPWVPLLAWTPFAIPVALLAAVVALALRVRAAAVVALVAALVLAGLVAPRALGGDAPGGPRELRVLTVNLQVAAAAPEDVVALVRASGADVLAVQEANARWVDRALTAGLREALPERVDQTGPFTRGTSLWSRLPLEPLPPWGTGFLNPIARGVVDVGGTAVELAVVHPPPPTRRGVARRDRELRALPPAQPRGRLRVLLGDFNATLDHEPFRELLGTGYRDAAATVGAGLRPTWPSRTRPLPPVTIDHVLADRRIGFRDVEVTRLPRTDHRPVAATLVLP